MGEWLEAEIALLKDYSAKNMSAQQMSDALQGRSRNSCIGYCRRNDIPLQSKRTREYSPRPAKQIRNAKPQKARVTPIDNIKYNEDLERLFKSAGKVLLMEAGKQECRWPMGGEPLRPMACGEKIAKGSYCGTHYRFAHR